MRRRGNREGLKREKGRGRKGEGESDNVGGGEGGCE
jgi:hypothetical protein